MSGRSLIIWLGWLGVAVAGCGGDGGAGDDAVGDAAVDAGLACGQLLCETIGARCGVATDGCGDPVDCGECPYQDSDVAKEAIEPAIAVSSDQVVIAYVATAPGYELRLATDGPEWTSEPVLALGGPPRGPVDLAVGPDGTRWIAFVDDVAQIRVASAPALGAWTTSAPLGTGTAVAIAIDGDGEPVVALAGLVESTSGVFVATRVGEKWELAPVGSPTGGGAPPSIAIVARGDELLLSWRDPGKSLIRFARGRGSAFAIEVVDPLAAAPADDGALALATGPLGDPHALYGRGPGELVVASRQGETWRGTVLATDAADHDSALVAGAGGLVGAFFAAGGLSVVDGLGGAWLFQGVADECDDGDVDLALDPAGGLHVAFSCGVAVRHLYRPPAID